MVAFTVHRRIYDPYKNFKFRVQWNGRNLAGVDKVSRVLSTTEVVTHRGGAHPSGRTESPGLRRYVPITLEHGIIYDAEFMKWANKESSFASAQCPKSRTAPRLVNRNWEKG